MSGSRILFIQGLIAWLSVCLLLTVIWDRNQPDTPRQTHEFTASSPKDQAVLAEKKKSLFSSTAEDSVLAKKSLGSDGVTYAPASVPRDKPRGRETVEPESTIHEPQQIENTEKLMKMLMKSMQDEVAEVAHKGVSEASVADSVRNERGHPSVPWLPDAPLARTIDESKVSVFMDWGRGNLAFTLANYRSLESVLSHHPNAEVCQECSSFVPRITRAPTSRATTPYRRSAFRPSHLQALRCTALRTL
jgi:hypothetical protein